MRSFFFWLSTAFALGLVIRMFVSVGFPEVVIIWAIANGIYYGIWRKLLKAAPAR